jgi:hypothetical protein
VPMVLPTVLSLRSVDQSGNVCGGCHLVAKCRRSDMARAVAIAGGRKLQPVQQQHQQQ